MTSPRVLMFFCIRTLISCIG
ncbi:hypothetical protein LINPERPRIM_LOCUS25012 [Linum perenne]